MTEGRIVKSTIFGALVGAVLAGTFMVSPAQAQDDKKWSLSLTFDFVTQYFFRGIIQEDDGVIFQPGVEFGYVLWEPNNEFINSVDVYAGWWNSVHSEETGSQEDDAAAWYETDLYAGFNVKFLDYFTTGVGYTYYESPNAAFDRIHEVSTWLNFDDSFLWEDWGVEIPGFSGLQPYFFFAFEVDGQADGGADEGIYWEFGFAPEFLILDNEQFPVTLSLPFTFGFNPDNYYEVGGSDEFFGYFDFGADFSAPLTFMPEEAGAWSIYAGVHVITLSDDLEAVNTGDETEVYGKFGFSVEF